MRAVETSLGTSWGMNIHFFSKKENFKLDFIVLPGVEKLFFAFIIYTLPHKNYLKQLREY